MRKTILLTALTLAAALNVSATTLTEKLDRTFDVKPGATVAVANVNGSITVHAWDQPRVRIVAEKTVKAGNATATAEAMKKLVVKIEPTADAVRVTTHYPRNKDNAWGLLDWITGDNIDANVRYDVYVPRNSSLDLESVNGSVVASDINGKHEVSTVNGKIEMTRCAGSLQAATVNGSVHAELTQVTKNQPIRISTTNGRISLVVPQTLGANVDADTTNGSIDSDLPIATTRVSRNSLRGTINGGGSDLRLSTTNGGIEIRTR